MKWCCLGFQGNFQKAGTRGFGVFVTTQNGPEPEFVLQHRAVDPGKSVTSLDYPVSLVSDMQLQFCPWCGVKLKDWYRKTFKELDRPDLKVPTW